MRTCSMIIKDMAVLAAVGAISACAYKMMSPEDRNEISREVKKTADDICDVKKDVSEMAGTIKQSF